MNYKYIFIMELQNYIDSNIDDYITKFKDLDLTVKNFSKENLILVKYKYNKELSENWMRYCRGCIINKLTNKIIFVPPIKAKNIEYPINDLDILKNSDIEITNLIDGTMINLFYHNDKWIISTRSDIGCLNKWNNRLNFKKMFEECIQDNDFYNNLNKNYTYSFVLLHNKNRNISYIINNCIILIEVYNKDTLEKLNVKDINLDTNILTLENLNYQLTNILDINNYFLLSDFNFKGLNININNERYNIINPKFNYVKELCINSTNLLEKYIYLKKNKNIKIYLNFYPELVNIFKNYSDKYEIMINELYNNYVKKNITKEIKLNDIPFQLKPLIFELHGIYLKTKIKINKKIIENYIMSLDIYKIIFILKYY
ncbi:MAG: hypothetical protein CMG74_06670 [Candidatus Marinimicrobia bacterium]|nr:hypothetical protein [Candidatus Neomarinimicrobiota bacterium]